MFKCDPNAWLHGPLTRYVKLRVAHAPGMPGTFSLPLRVSDPDMHHGTCVTHMPWSMPGSLTSSFLWGLWLGKRSRHFRRMRNPQFCLSGKRPMKSYQASKPISGRPATCPPFAQNRPWTLITCGIFHGVCKGCCCALFSWRCSISKSYKWFIYNFQGCCSGFEIVW